MKTAVSLATIVLTTWIANGKLAAQDPSPPMMTPIPSATDSTLWAPSTIPAAPAATPLPVAPIAPVTPDITMFEEPPPSLAQPDYAWYDLRNVLSPVFWEGNIQFGLNGSAGNAESLSLRSGFELSRETERTNWDIDFTYAKTEQSGDETQHNALLWSNWDWKLANPKWSWFIKSGLEYDEFKNFDLRLSKNTGLGYLLVDTPATQFRGRFGAGVSHEIGGDNEDVVAEAVFGFDFAHQFNEANKLSVVHDYYPEWSDFENFRQVTDAGWEILLSQASGVSLKVGVIHRFDSTPEGAEKSDVDYSVLLLWAL